MLDVERTLAGGDEPGGSDGATPRAVAAVVAVQALHAQALAALVDVRCGVDADAYDPSTVPADGGCLRPPDLVIVCGWGDMRPFLELVQQASEVWSGIPLVVVADGLTAAHVGTLSRCGVCALLDGGASASSIGYALGQVLQGRHLYAVKLEPTPEHDVAGLSGRQLDVLRLLAEGRSNREIGGSLCISVNTVKFHVHSILTQLGLRNRTEAARLFVEPTRTDGPKTTPAVVGASVLAP